MWFRLGMDMRHEGRVAHKPDNYISGLVTTYGTKLIKLYSQIIKSTTVICTKKVFLVCTLVLAVKTVVLSLNSCTNTKKGYSDLLHTTLPSRYTVL